MMDIGKDLQSAYEEGYKQGRFDEKVESEKWIPVSERLPENIRPVLVTWKNNDPKSYYQYIVGKHFIGTAHYHKGKWHWYSSVTEDLLAEYGKCETEEFDEAIEVIAWMPLPEPYKEETMNRKRDWSRCPLRTKLWNCNPIGGFCTSVNDHLCGAVRGAFQRGYERGFKDGKCQQRQKSEWIYVSTEKGKVPICSICHRESQKETNYCHYCGANMRGKENG